MGNIPKPTISPKEMLEASLPPVPDRDRMWANHPASRYFMQLPFDADGMPCQIGDILVDDNGRVFEVCAVGEDLVVFDDLDDADRGCWRIASTCRHHIYEATYDVTDLVSGEVTHPTFSIDLKGGRVC